MLVKNTKKRHWLHFNLFEHIAQWACFFFYYCYYYLGNGISGISKLHPPGPGCPKRAVGERENGEDRRFWPHQEHQGQWGILHSQRGKRKPCLLVSKEKGMRCKLENTVNVNLWQLRSNHFGKLLKKERIKVIVKQKVSNWLRNMTIWAKGEGISWSLFHSIGS